MRILHVIASMNPATGGPCQGIRNSIPVLEKLGIYREVVSLDDPQEKFVGTDSFPLHALGPRKTSWQYSSKLMPWLYQNLNRFDFVIVNGLWLYHGYAVRKALKHMAEENSNRNHKAPVPKLLVMPHGMLDPYFQKASHRKLKAIRNWFYWKLIESKIIRDAEGLLFTCQTELELAKDTFEPYRPKRELNIGYGVAEPPPFMLSMQQALLKRFPLLENAHYFLFLSRVHNKKGVDMLLDAYLRLLNQSTGMPIPKLIVAGPGMETAYGKELQQQVDNNEQLKECVLFTGMLSGDLKWGAFYGCETFILPSHQENFGIAVVEALACGKAVLISNQVNIWKEIESCGAGLVAENSPQGTYSLLEKWEEMSPSEKAKAGSNALGCYETHFTTEAASKNLYNVLSQLTFFALPFVL